MENVPKPLDRRVKNFYLMAEEYGEVDAKEISPSFYSLKKTTQRYESYELLASGGMKQIYKVYGTRTKRQLAMALLHDDAPEDLFDPFIHEAWLTARLDHPNIITIHDIGINEQDRPYFTMDLKQGDSLREVIERLHSNDRKTKEHYPQETLLQIFMKVCDAVAYAHSNQVLHLDLKPSNIQVGDYGQVLVCDWGLGRVVGQDDPGEIDRQLLNPDLFGSSNLIGELKGTPGYMAPEQFVEDGALDVRTDVYGLGGILYSLLTLLRPMSGDDEEILKRMKEEEAIVPPQQRTPEREVPASLNAVVMKALAVDPKNRYASVSALRAEVHCYLTGFATQAEEAGVVTQLHLFYRRNRRFCLTLFCAALIIIVGTALSFWEVSEKERAATVARQEAERTLALYEAGRSALETMTSRNAESVVALATRYEIEGRVDGARAVLKTALEQEPENPIYLRAMGIHYFVEQRFGQAVTFLESSGDDDVIYSLSQEYATFKVDDAILGVNQVIDLLSRLPSRATMQLKLIMNDQNRRANLTERAKIVKAYLQNINPDWVDGWFEFDAAESALRVGGSGLRRLATQQSVLDGLRLRSLDVSGSEVEDLWRESGYVLESLDIHDTPMKQPWFLRRFIHLKTLAISPGQFTPEQLQVLPDQVKIIERD